MRTTLTTIIIVASVSPLAFGGLTITVPEITVSDQGSMGSFEVFINTNETHSLSIHQTQLNLPPGSSGITFTSAVMTETVDHSYVFPGSTGNFEWSIANEGATIEVQDVFEGSGSAPNLVNGAGLFRVTFDIAPGTLLPDFGLTINTDPDVTALLDGGFQPLAYTVVNGNIHVEQGADSHRLRVDFHEKVAGVDGNWERKTSTLVLTYGENGATSARIDSGVHGDITTGWGNGKFRETREEDYGIYTRGTPFGPGDDMLVRDARELDDTANVLIETYTNKVFDEPSGGWEDDAWNEGGTLEFTVESAVKTYFDGFQIVQKEPGRFLDHAGVDTLLGSVLDASGHGFLPFDRIGCDWPDGTEIDWWIGPFAGFDLIPPDGTALSDLDALLSVEPGTYAIGHPPTPEPSALMVLAIAGFGVCARRRKFRSGQE